MAVQKRRASRQMMQRSHEVITSESPERPSKSTLVCEATVNLNRGFDQVLNEVARLKQMGFFRGEISNRLPELCRLIVEELRAWAMADIAQDIHDSADRDWSRYGIQRYRFEQKFRDPVDVRRELERVVKTLNAHAAKRKQKRPQGSSSR
jgi:hypothetical protein